MRKNGGQIALVVLLVSAVVMTLGLSLSRKVTVETKIGGDEESLKRAFNAAESGIDYYLSTRELQYQSADQRSRAEVSTSEVGVGVTVDFGEVVVNGKTEYYWLVGHQESGALDLGNKYSGAGVDVCPEPGFSGGLRVSYFFVEGGNYKVERYGYNYGVGTTVAGFTPTNGCASIVTGIGPSRTGLLVTINPIGSSGRFYLRGSENFPSQGEEVSSVGKVEVREEVVAKTMVKIINRYRLLPFMIDAVTAGVNVGN